LGAGEEEKGMANDLEKIWEFSIDNPVLNQIDGNLGVRVAGRSEAWKEDSLAETGALENWQDDQLRMNQQVDPVRASWREGLSFGLHCSVTQD
jgi:hypothetical protein